MQRRLHEQKFINLGTIDSSVLATSLAEWTTERHRLNAHFAVTYRASDASPALAGVIDESRRFIETVEAALPAPQPYRDHPYWIGAIAAHRREILRRKQRINPLSAPSKAGQSHGRITLFFSAYVIFFWVTFRRCGHGIRGIPITE